MLTTITFLWIFCFLFCFYCRTSFLSFFINDCIFKYQCKNIQHNQTNKQKTLHKKKANIQHFHLQSSICFLRTDRVLYHFFFVAQHLLLSFYKTAFFHVKSIGICLLSTQHTTTNKLTTKKTILLKSWRKEKEKFKKKLAFR